MKKFFRLLFQTTIILIIVIFLFEISYRFSIVDFYKAEFNTLNDENDIQSKDVDYLVFGDSFSATGNNYVDFLRNNNNKSVVNSSVPGIGIKQVNTFENRRLKKFNPKNIIYQVYVGNDLTDVDHLTNYKKLSLVRNLYWDISDVILSSSYINYRLGALKVKVQQEHRSLNKEAFRIQDYNNRSRMYFRSDPEYLQKSVKISEDFQGRYSVWIKEIREFVELVPENTRIHIVFIPHCAQVNSFYYNNIRQIGATFKSEEEFSKINYGFFEKASLDLKNYKNVTLLNPLKRLREDDTIDNRLYYLNDPHLNDAGQKLLGRYLREQLVLNE